METIELSGRTGQEVYEELKHRLEGMGYLPDEYFLLGRNGERKGSADMPKILSAHDAVRQYIHDGDTVTFGGLSDNDFLPVTNKAGESYRYLALV